jgi:hypothetical protein
LSLTTGRSRRRGSTGIFCPISRCTSSSAATIARPSPSATTITRATGIGWRRCGGLSLRHPRLCPHDQSRASAGDGGRGVSAAGDAVAWAAISAASTGGRGRCGKAATARHPSIARRISSPAAATSSSTRWAPGWWRIPAIVAGQAGARMRWAPPTFSSPSMRYTAHSGEPGERQKEYRELFRLALDPASSTRCARRPTAVGHWATPASSGASPRRAAGGARRRPRPSAQRPRCATD